MPAESDTVSDRVPVLSWTVTTVTPGSTPPCGSTICPVRVARYSCATAAGAQNATTDKIIRMVTSGRQSVFCTMDLRGATHRAAPQNIWGDFKRRHTIVTIRARQDAMPAHWSILLDQLAEHCNRS